MDRDRLKQVQQTDLTESRVNQDLVDWLRDKGLTYLLIILLLLVAFVLYHRWQEGREARWSAAYLDLSSATQPTSLEIIAEDHARIGSVSDLARLRAARLHYAMHQVGYDFESGEQLTPEQSVERLGKARSLFERVVQDNRDVPSEVLFRIRALFGLAAIAEDEADYDRAATHYEEIARIAAPMYPPMAEVAQARRRSLDEVRQHAGLPAAADLPPRRFLNPMLEDLFQPHLIEVEEGS